MSEAASPTRIIDRSHDPLALREVPPGLRWLLASVAGLHRLRPLYRLWLEQVPNPGPADGMRFVDFAVDQLGLASSAVETDSQAIPGAGSPLIVVANHPLGGVEGLLLVQWLSRHRSDIRVVANRVLLAFPEFHELFIGMDVFSADAQRRNANALRACHHHLASGGALLCFPAGTVGHLQPGTNDVTDAPWRWPVERLARRYGAHCLPVAVGGRNPDWFYAAGRIHPRLRTALLPRMLTAMAGKPVALTIGRPTSLDHFPEGVATQWLRGAVTLLGSARKQDSCGVGPTTIGVGQEHSDSLPPARAVTDNIKRSGQSLVHSGDWTAYLLAYESLSPGTREFLGQAREHSFRAVGEGSGQRIDQDRFDAHYDHLVVWDHASESLVGGYRLADARNVARRKGLDGLYSHSLFAYSADWLDELPHPVEVGRSYVMPAYQKTPKALDMLWRGIGAYVLQVGGGSLFGCVSVSARFNAAARDLIRQTLLCNHSGARSDGQGEIRPRFPVPHSVTWPTELLQALDDPQKLDRLLRQNHHGLCLPVLIRQYLKLGAEFRAFSRNPWFSDATDGLMVVRLANMPPRFRQRYLTREDATS